MNRKHSGCRIRRGFLYIAFFYISLCFIYAQEDDIERYRKVIRYGTDTEIANLIQTLKTQNIDALDGELAGIAGTTKNAAVQNAILGFFTEREQPAIADTALALIRSGQERPDGAVTLAALEYIAKTRLERAASDLIVMIQSDEARYQHPAIRALGRVSAKSGADGKEKAAAFLREFYQEKASSEETKRVIIEAMGEGEMGVCADFVREVIGNTDLPAGLRIEALGAAGKIGKPEDEALRRSVVACLGASEPVVRAAAVGALGAFSGEEIEAALLDALRDSFFRTRLAAEKALAVKKPPAAIEFLAFRAQNDEAAAVREEAVKTLGAYANAAANDALESIYDEKRTAEKVRMMAAEALIKNNDSKYTKKFTAALEDAKKSKQKTVYSGLLKALAASKAPEMKALAGSLLSSAEVTDRAFAIDIIANNTFANFREELQKIADDGKNPLRIKAKNALAKM